MKDVSWGLMLESKELHTREQAWEEAVLKLKKEVATLIDGHGYHIIILPQRLVCLDCPEKPNECVICQVDSGMSSHLTKPALTITLYREEDR